MNIQKHVKIMVNVSETEKFCNILCGFIAGNYCNLFKQKFNEVQDKKWEAPIAENNYYAHVRLPKCIEHQID